VKPVIKNGGGMESVWVWRSGRKKTEENQKAIIVKLLEELVFT